MTEQPIWKKLGQIGDINPIEYGGGYVFTDETGVYDPELEYIEPMPEPDTDAYVYRVSLERYKLSSTGHLVPFKYNPTWPYPEDSYIEWFDKDLEQISSFAGITREELVTALCSDNAMARASACETLAQYFGWEEFDSYPLHLSESELEERYSDQKYQ